MKENTIKKKSIGLIIGLIVGLLVVLVTIFIIVVLTIFVLSSKSRKLNNQLNLGEKYITEFDYDNAIIAYQKAIEIDSKSEEAYLGLANVYIFLGDYENAINVLEEGHNNTNSSSIYAQLETLYGLQRIEENAFDDHSQSENVVEDIEETEESNETSSEVDTEELVSEENTDELQEQDDSQNSNNNYNVEVWDETMVMNVQNQICEHYQNLYNPPGNYAIFNESDIADEDSMNYTMFLRYQMSEAEAEEIINSGGMPQANILVTAVYINKQTGEVSDDLANEVWVLE